MLSSGKHILVAAVLVTILAWQLVASITSLAREVGSRSTPYSYRLFAPEDQRIRDALGAAQLKLESLHEHLPVGSTTICLGPIEPSLTNEASFLRHLLYPRLLMSHEQALDLMDKKKLVIDSNVYVLDMRPGEQTLPKERLRPIAAGVGFELWQYRGSGP